MNNNLQLPNTGATNWGSGLNAYIRHLADRVSTLEESVGDIDINNVVNNISGACSGIVSNYSCELNDEDNAIHFSGTVFFAGDIMKAIEIESTNWVTSTALPADNKKISYFVYLKYSSNVSGDEFDKLSIEYSPDLSLNYSKILLGFYYNNDFVPYYYWSLKMIMQHQYELMNPYALVDENGVNISVNNGQVKSESGSIGVTMGPTTFEVLCGGLGWAKNPSDVNINLQPEILPYEVTIKNTVNNFLTDSVDTSSHKIITSIDASNISTIPSANNYSNIYRILLDIFGNIFIQKAYCNDESFDIDNRNSEQYLLNTRFGRRMYAKDTSGNYTYSLQANLFMEIGRFGFSGNATKGSYVMGTTASASAAMDNIVYTRSLKDGVASQPFQNVWVTQDSHLYLDKIKFSNDGSDDNYFQFKHDDENVMSRTVNKTLKSLTTNNLWSSYDIDSIEYPSFQGNGVITFKDNVVEVYIEDYSGTPVLFKPNEEVELYWNDDGESLTCKCTQSDDKLVLTFEPSTGFTETASKDIQNLVLMDIIVGKVELNFKESYAVKGSPTVMWLQTNADTENILIENDYGNLYFTSSGITEFGGVNGLQLTSGDYIILSDDTTQKTELTLYSNPKTTESGGAWGLVDEGYRSNVKHYTINNNTGTNYFSDYIITHSFPKSGGEDYKSILKHNFKVGSDGYLLEDVLVLYSDDIEVKGNIKMDEGKEILFTSDYRRKEDFKAIGLQYLPVVCDVPVINYRYKNSSKQQVGIIAQDLEKVMNKNIDCFVSIEETADIKDQRSLNETKLVYILWKALQEEVQERKKLEQRLANLEN